MIKRNGRKSRELLENQIRKHLSYFKVILRLACIIVVMKQTRIIRHDNTHFDVEQLFPSGWAVIECNCKLQTQERTMNGYIESDHQVNYRQWNSAMRDAGFSLPNGLPLNSEAEADKLHSIVSGIDKPVVDEIDAMRWTDDCGTHTIISGGEVLELSATHNDNIPF